MSESNLKTPLPKEASHTNLRKFPRGLFLLLAVLLTGGIITFLVQLNGAEHTHVWRIFLVNFLFWSGVSVAGVILAAIFQVTNARWALPIKWLAATCAAYLPISFLLLLGIWFGRRTLFSWVEQPRMAVQPWLNVPFFFFREMVGLLLLYGLAFLFFYRSARQDVNALARGHPESSSLPITDSASLRRLAVVLLILYALVYSLLAWDFVMSLDPSWSSALFGAYYFVGNLYLGLAAVTILAVSARRFYRLEKIIDSQILHNLGKLLFAFSLLWTYLFWSQYLVIWYGNLPQEIGFVLLRTAQKPWNSLAITVLVMNFLIPFLLLLFRSLKENPKTLLVVALVIFVGMWLERYLLVMPSLAPFPPNLVGWVELMITLGFLSSFLLTYLCALVKAPTFP